MTSQQYVHNRRCRCPECLEQLYRYGKAYRLDCHRNGPRTVPADKAIAYCRQLAAAGWSQLHLAALAEVDYETLGALLRGERSRITRARELRILAMEPSPHNAPSPTTLVPSIGARRRVQALYRLGWTSEAISAAGDAPGRCLTRIFSHHGKHCTADVWMTVARAYRTLATRPGPSDRTRQRAERAGYPSPAAWEDGSIDDPTARACTSVWTPGRVDLSEVEFLARAGETWRSIADRMQVTVDAVQAAVRRAGRRDLAAILERTSPQQASQYRSAS